MILPGDILWDRFRVARVESERLSCAWLRPIQTGKDAAATHLLLSLKSPGRMALAELLASIWPGAVASPAPGDGHATLPLLGKVEWRGDPEAGGVALLECARADALEALRSSAPPDSGTALRLAASFAAGLERMLDFAAAKPGGVPAFCRAAAALLNPRAVGLTADGSRLVFLPAPEPAESATASALEPPYWTMHAAPEAIAGQACGEAALVFGVAQLALTLLFAPLSADATPTPAVLRGWQRLAVSDIAFKEFKRDPRTASLPKKVAAILARCLRSQDMRRFPTLAKLRAALKKLSRADELRDASSALFSPAVTAGAAAAAIPPGMTVVEAGPYLSGEKKAPRTLRAFAIDLTPVTEKEYRDYLKDIQLDPRPGGPGSRAQKYDKHPVVNVTWREAEEFAAHYGKRLPTIYEWEKAARGKDGRKFPYGNEYAAGTGKLRASNLNTPAGKEVVKETAPIGSFPKGASPFGALDMAGNVLEWTSTARRQGDRIFRALKGACFLDGSVELSRCAALQYKKPDTRESNVGFRCVMDLGVEEAKEKGLGVGG